MRSMQPMRKAILIMAILGTMAAAGALAETNPFFETWTTPFGTPPFDRITLDNFKPAYLKGMADQQAEIALITTDPGPATFANTIEALDASGALLRGRSSAVFGALNGTMTNDDMQALARDLSPLTSRHRDEILLNGPLFQRVDAVYQQRDKLNLDREQQRLLEETWKRFVRGWGQPVGRRQGKAQGPEPGAFPAVAQVRRERAEGDQPLRTGDRRFSRPGRPARGRDRRGRRDGHRARPSGPVGVHASRSPA